MSHPSKEVRAADIVFGGDISSSDRALDRIRDEDLLSPGSGSGFADANRMWRRETVPVDRVCPEWEGYLGRSLLRASWVWGFVDRSSQGDVSE